MERNLVIIIVTLFISLTAKGQNLFFIGEHSYPCTDTSTLKSDSDKFYINDLNLVFAKDGKSAIIAVSTETKDVLIREKLIIYLNDGTVITLNDGISEYVNKVALAAYKVTDEELEKMKKSNIIKIRYSLLNDYGRDGAFGGNFSASNISKINFPALITEFYK